MKIGKDETVVTAFAETAEGPGWFNTPVWVVIRARDHTLRMECLQSEEQTSRMLTLYSVSAACHNSMKGAIDAMIFKARQEKEGTF